MLTRRSLILASIAVPVRTANAAIRTKILVDNPSRLYGY
jgi:hypothetical protein